LSRNRFRQATERVNREGQSFILNHSDGTTTRETATSQSNPPGHFNTAMTMNRDDEASSNSMDTCGENQPPSTNRLFKHQWLPYLGHPTPNTSRMPCINDQSDSQHHITSRQHTTAKLVDPQTQLSAPSTLQSASSPANKQPSISSAAEPVP